MDYGHDGDVSKLGQSGFNLGRCGRCGDVGAVERGEPMSNRTRIIDEEQVHSAVEYLRDSAHQLGKARERARKAEHWIKHVEALCFKKSDERSAEARKADARIDERYVEAITEDAIATGELAKLYALREAAAAVVEAWRTESATLRSVKL